MANDIKSARDALEIISAWAEANLLDDSAANGVSDCALFWAQMPYEKGGDK